MSTSDFLNDVSTNLQLRICSYLESFVQYNIFKKKKEKKKKTEFYLKLACYTWA